MDSLYYEQLHNNALNEVCSGAHCTMTKPLPHKPSLMATRCCQFKLNLHTLRHSEIHRGISMIYSRKWINTNIRTPEHSVVFKMWKPFVNGLFDKLIPTVCAKEVETGNKELGNKKAELRQEELFGQEELPVEMLADKILRNETGWDRLKEMYGRYESGGPTVFSPEVSSMIAVLFNTTLATFLFGYFIGHRKCAQEFEQKHYHTKWPSKFRAARAYRDAVFIEGAKFGGMFAARTAGFLGIWMLVATSITVYRNKTSFIEHVVAGTTAGAVFGINLGLRGIFARGVIGGTFGLVAGVIFYFGFTSMKDTQEQRRYWIIVSRLQEARDLQQMVSDD